MVWRKGFDVLATSHTVLSADPRISVERHNGVDILSIRDITEHDAGEYVCQVSQDMPILCTTLTRIYLFRSLSRMIFYLCSTLWTC